MRLAGCTVSWEESDTARWDKSEIMRWEDDGGNPGPATATASETVGLMDVEDDPRITVLGSFPRPEVVYLAGPYRPYVDSGGTRHTISQSVRKMGYVALVPHTLTYLAPRQQRQDGGLGDIPPEQFMAGELELVRRSDMVVLMPEWKYSAGAQAEKLFAEMLGIPVYEWDDFVQDRAA
jgi:hypothetical protein